MPVPIKPHEMRAVPLTNNVDAIKKDIMDEMARLVPFYEQVTVFNKTRTCMVNMYVNCKRLVIEVTNEEEDQKFRFENSSTPETTPETDPSTNV